MMTTEFYEKEMKSITEISHRLESILPDGNEMARRDLINIRQMAEVNLEGNYLSQTNLSRIHASVLNIMIYPYILEGIKKGSIDPKINCKVYLKINAFFEEMKSELQLKINSEK